MNKFDVSLRLEKLRDQKNHWRQGKREFDREFNKILDTLILHSAKAHMSIGDVSTLIGMSRKYLRPRYNRLGLIANQSKTLLADTAARVLAENAELLGVDIDKFDLTSPLAYLPAGDAIRREAQDRPVVTDIDEPRCCPDCGMGIYCGNCGPEA